MTIYSPPRRAPRGTRLIFLIGPIQGAADWQGDAATIIGKKAPGIVIASPRSGMWEPGLAKSEKARLFNIQREWEWDHIELAIRLDFTDEYRLPGSAIFDCKGGQARPLIFRQRRRVLQGPAHLEKWMLVPTICKR